MKLTKVLVGLLAVSLCGAVGAVKNRPLVDLSSNELMSKFITSLRAGDLDNAKLYFTELKDKRAADFGVLKGSLKSELLRRFSDETLYDDWKAGKGRVPAKVTALPTKKGEVKKEEAKGGWDIAWGVEPKWDDATAVGSWSDDSSLKTKDKALASELTYAIAKMEASPLKDAFDNYIKQAKADLASIK